MNKLFKKKNQTNLESGIDLVEVVNDFSRRTLFWNYRPQEYKIYRPFDEIKKELDSYLEKLFEGDIDEANGTVLDTIILDRCRQAKKDLAKQRVNHRDHIKSFDIRAKSDEVTYTRELERMKIALDMVCKRLEKYEELSDKDVFILGGKRHEK